MRTWRTSSPNWGARSRLQALFAIRGAPRHCRGRVKIFCRLVMHRTGRGDKVSPAAAPEPPDIIGIHTGQHRRPLETLAHLAGIRWPIYGRPNSYAKDKQQARYVFCQRNSQWFAERR